MPAYTLRRFIALPFSTLAITASAFCATYHETSIPLSDFMARLSREANINIVFERDLGRNIAVDLTNVDPLEAMNVVARQQGFVVRLLNVGGPKDTYALMDAKKAHDRERTVARMKFLKCKELAEHYQRVLPVGASLEPSDWLGEYIGDERNLRLLTGARFVLESTGYHGVNSTCVGSYTIRNRILTLNRENSEPEATKTIFPLYYLLVPWHTRHFLVSVDDISAFCDHVTSGTDPRESTLLRDQDRSLPVSGEPELPPEFAPRVFAIPVKGIVRGILTETGNTVLLQIEDRRRLKVGARLYWVDKSHKKCGVLDVSSISADTVLATIASEPSVSTPVSIPSRGDEVSTRAFDCYHPEPGESFEPALDELLGGERPPTTSK